MTVIHFIYSHYNMISKLGIVFTSGYFYTNRMGKIVKVEVLTDKAKMYLHSYLIDLNIKSACIRIGCSRNYATVLMRKKIFKDALNEHFRKAASAVNVTLQDVISEYARIAFYDLKDHIKDIVSDAKTGEFGLKLHELKDIDTRSLSSIQMSTDSNGIPVVKIKTHDKLKALDKLYDHLKDYKGPNSLHLHVTKEQLKDLPPDQVASRYRLLASGQGNNG